MHSGLRLSRRVQQISTSATKAMALAAAQLGDCVSLGQGVPSFATPTAVIEALITALRRDAATGKYSLQSGMPALRQRIARFLREEKQVLVDADTELCVTVGGMEALAATVLSLVDEGDEVILPSPTYASYIEQILLAGGKAVCAPLTAEWRLDMAAIEAALSQRTRALMLCNPGNPTGNVLSREEMLALCEFARRHDLMLVLDDTYDYLIHQGGPVFCPLSLPQYRAKVALISSMSKKYALTGWRVGWVAAGRPLMAQIMKAHDAITLCAPTPSQHAALAAFDLDASWFAATKEALLRRRELCCQRLDALAPFFSYVPPQGAFYIMARYLFSEKPSQHVALELLHGARVITIPGAQFGLGGEGHLRLSFGGEEDEINLAFDRMERWLRAGFVSVNT